MAALSEPSRMVRDKMENIAVVNNYGLDYVSDFFGVQRFTPVIDGSQAVSTFTAMLFARSACEIGGDSVRLSLGPVRVIESEGLGGRNAIRNIREMMLRSGFSVVVHPKDGQTVFVTHGSTRIDTNKILPFLAELHERYQADATVEITATVEN